MDRDPITAGIGSVRLRNAGIEVITGCLQQESFEINKRFFHFLAHQRPYVILKWAQTSDGFIDVIRQSTMPQKPNWITRIKQREC